MAVVLLELIFRCAAAKLADCACVDANVAVRPTRV